MARYIDADKKCKELTDMAIYQDPYKQSTILGVVGTIKNTRTADVVPRAEVVREIIEDVATLMEEHWGEIQHGVYWLVCGRCIALRELLKTVEKKYTEGEK